MSGPRVRFAPSPTGSLHVGNARTALFNWLVARKEGGTFILRIEDTDTARGREGSEASILEDLRWLGLTWDEGPFRQSERGEAYRAAVTSLLAAGGAFRCFCPPRGDDETRTAGHRDPCRALDAAASAARAGEGEPHAIRLRVPQGAEPDGAHVRFEDRLRGTVEVPLAQISDAVLLRHDGRPTYNFAVVVDDAAMRVDLVLRGDDHLSNTPVQVLIGRALGVPIPGLAHLPMVLGPDGERLSKRHGAASVASWRERGVPPEALLNGLALLGWAPPGDATIVTVDDLVRDFDLDRVGRSSAIFDPAKIEWISSQHIHAMPGPKLAAEIAGRLAVSDSPWVAEVAELLRPSLATFDQVVPQAEPLFHAGGPLDEEARGVLRAPTARPVLLALASALPRADLDGAEGWSSLRLGLEKATALKGRALFQPVRAALFGRAHGREMDRLVPLVARGSSALPDRVPTLASRVARTLEAA